MITLSAAWKMLLAALAGTMLSASQVAAGEGSIEEERNRQLVASGLQAWADGTGSPYDLLADDVQWTITGNSLAAGTYPNKKAFLSDVIRPFNARMRERLVPTLHRLYAEGDTVIVHFDARSIARDGTPYVNSYAWILQLSGGRIVRAHAFFDSIVFDDLWRRVKPAADPSP
jgi:uncharacterized protein